MLGRDVLLSTLFSLGLCVDVGCGRNAIESPTHRVEPTAPVVHDDSGFTFPTEGPSAAALVTVPAFANLRFKEPVALVSAPGQPEFMYVVERSGRILRFANRPDVREATVFLDLREHTRTSHPEEGALGLAFPSNFVESGVFYVSRSISRPRRTQISRFVVGSDGVAEVSSEEPLLGVKQPYGNHNGGSLAFGPDGHLYAGFGDGGAADDPHGEGQDPTSLLGTIVRIAVDDSGPYRIPAGNPFAHQGNATRPEIWAMGLRNPWRISFDRQRGTLWVGDVGQDEQEEIDVVVAGGNYGWRLREGNREFSTAPPAAPSFASTLIEPVHVYGRNDGVSVTGGFVYRGAHLPAYRGLYIYGDFGSGKVWALDATLDRTGQATKLSNKEVARVPSLASFGEDAAGELYAVSLEGRIYRFEPRTKDEAAPAFPSKLSQTGLFTDLASLTPSDKLVPMKPRRPFWSDDAKKTRYIYVPAGHKITLEDDRWVFPLDTLAVKHFEIDLADGSRRRLETRVMVHETRGWAGYTYRWNEAQTDAELLGEPVDERIETSAGGQTWNYPAGTGCLRCHNSAAGGLLGVNAAQLGAVQLSSWLDAQMIGFEYDAATDLGAQYDEHPARAYLAVNCAICHQPGAPAPGGMDLRFNVPLEDMGIVGVAADEPLEGARMRVAPGNPDASALFTRIAHPGRHHMPPIGSHKVDVEGTQLLGEWIKELRAPAPEHPAKKAAPAALPSHPQ